VQIVKEHEPTPNTTIGAVQTNVGGILRISYQVFALLVTAVVADGDSDLAKAKMSLVQCLTTGT
jgi:hypothetical protein